MTWLSALSLPALDITHFGSLDPIEILYEFDGPCIFTAITNSGTLVLAYLYEELDEGRRFIVATTSESTIDGMKKGVVSVREALDRGSLSIVDVDHADVPSAAFAVQARQLPEDALPLASTMLWAELEPAMVVRFEGEEIRPGQIPAAVLVQAAEIPGKALKPVFDWAAGKLHQGTGRPPDWLRQLYGLPAQRFAYGSLEVAFRPVEFSPETQEQLPIGETDLPTQREIHSNAWQALNDGLQWAVSEAALPSGADNERWLAILQAMKKMAPAPTGPVTLVEVRGTNLGSPSSPFRLDRKSSKRVRVALRELNKHHDIRLKVFRGSIRDLDLDRLSLILRDPPHEWPIQLGLDSELLESAREAHYHEHVVDIAARSEDKKSWIATDIQLVQEEPGLGGE